jgi:hypothetical protein
MTTIRVHQSFINSQFFFLLSFLPFFSPDSVILKIRKICEKAFLVFVSCVVFLCVMIVCDDCVRDDCVRDDWYDYCQRDQCGVRWQPSSPLPPQDVGVMLSSTMCV